MLLLEPEDRLYVSYRNTDSDGGGLKPSSFVRTLQKVHTRPDGSVAEAERRPDFGVHSRRCAVYGALERGACGLPTADEIAAAGLADELKNFCARILPT